MATATKKAPAKKASAKKAPAKKAPAKKAAVKKAVKKAPATKAPAKKAPAKKAVKKAPAKKPAAKKAAAKKAVKKSPVKKAAAKKAVKKPVAKKAKSPFGKKFIGEMKARLEEERAKYLHSEETYRAEADALIEGREPGDVQFDEESGEGDTLAVERERDLALSNQARQAVENRRRTRPHQGRYVRHLCRIGEVDPSRAPSCDPVGRRTRRVQGWRPRQPPLSRAGPTRPT